MHDPNEPFENLRALDVLAIAAHPDDVEQTCGGTLLSMAELGYRTGVLDLTAGEWAAEERPKSVSKKRKQRRSIFCLPGGRTYAGRMPVLRTPLRRA